jgi:hypothetical protein
MDYANFIAFVRKYASERVKRLKRERRKHHRHLIIATYVNSDDNRAKSFALNSLSKQQERRDKVLKLENSRFFSLHHHPLRRRRQMPVSFGIAWSRSDDNKNSHLLILLFSPRRCGEERERERTSWLSDCKRNGGVSI